MDVVRDVVQDLGGARGVARRLELPLEAIEYFLSEAVILPEWALDELIAAWHEENGAARQQTGNTE